jgi:hypothetical protein
MKSLFTILLSFIGCVSLIGQETTVPMVVAGKMHISGPVYSKGAVHVYANTGATVDTGKIDIDNSTTAVLATDTIILYSNNKSDGLLRNLNTSSGGVKGTATDATAPKKVVIRKNITHDNYTVISFPFGVQKVIGPLGVVLTPKEATNTTDNDNRYWAWEMDKKNRADWYKENDTGSWMDIGDTGLKKGTGYMFWSSDAGDVDFVTENTTDIGNLFSKSDDNKKLKVSVYKTKHYYGDSSRDALGSGWAYIGGLNTATFNLNSTNISDYGGATVAIREKYTSLANNTDNSQNFKQVFLVAESLELAPYVPFYVQYDLKDDVFAHGAEADSTFGFKNAGLLFNSAQYRSSREGASSIKDMLFFKLSSGKNNFYDRFYLCFSDDYTESFRASEDAVKLSTSSQGSPLVWSLLDDNGLFVNGLPMKDGREIRIGYSAPEAGDYTISMDALRYEDIRTAILFDNFTNEKIDMLQEPSYTFNTGVGVNEGRFILYINGSFTGAPAIEGGLVYAFVKDNILTVKNLSEGDRVQVLDLSGRTVVSGRASGKEYSTALSQKGVYVVNVKGGKTSVLKVLNK